MAKIKGDVINFEGVEAGGGGGGAKVPEGDYRVKVIKIERKPSKQDNDMLVWRYEITEGKYKGKKLRPVYTVLTIDSLWKLMRVVESLGMNADEISIKKTMKNALGKESGVTVVDGEEYNGKIPSEIAEHITLEEYEGLDHSDDDDEDEAPKAKKKGKKKGKGKKKKSEDEDVEELDLDGI